VTNDGPSVADLQALSASAARIGECRRVDALVNTLATEARALLAAGHVQVYLHDPKWRDFHGRRGPGGAEVRFAAGQGLAGRAAAQGRPVRAGSAPDEPGYDADIDSAPDASLTAVLAYPIGDPKDRLSAAPTPPEQPPRLRRPGAQAGALGVIEAFSPSLRPFTGTHEKLLGMLAEHASVALVRVRELDSEREFLLELTDALAQALDSRGLAAFDHAQRMRAYCRRLAEAAGLDEAARYALEVAAVLYDVGRIEMRPRGGAGGGDGAEASGAAGPQVLFARALVERVSFPDSLAQVPEAIRRHHEFVDGLGSGAVPRPEDMPRIARMLVVADSFERYLDASREAGGPPDVRGSLARLEEGAGKLFDDELVKLFVDRRCYDIEHRRYPRIEYEIPVEVQVLDEDGAATGGFATLAVDLSEGGIMFTAEAPMPLETLLRFRIDLPSGSMEATGRVARVLPGEDAGVRIGAFFLWRGSAG